MEFNKTQLPFMYKIILLSLITTFLFACAEPQQNFVHSISSTQGLKNAEIIYQEQGGANEMILTEALSKGDLEVLRLKDGVYTVQINDQSSNTIFKDVPSKYLNLDATVEVTRNIFQDYFPSEWEPMRGAQFTSIYIKNKNDSQVFYLKTVATGTDKEIGLHSEDY